MGSKVKNWEISCDCINAKLDYMLWCLQDTCSGDERGAIGRPNFVAQKNDTVQDYVLRFQEWKSTCWEGNVEASEEYFISIFFNGLKEEIKKLVQMWRPHTLSHAQVIAGFQETYVGSMTKKSEIGLIPLSRNNDLSSTFLLIGDQSRQNIENQMTPVDEVFAKAFSEKNSPSIPPQNYDQRGQILKEEMVPQNEALAKDFSEKIGDKKGVPEGQVSEKIPFDTDSITGEEKWAKQIQKTPSIIIEKRDLDNKLDCLISKISFVENSDEDIQKKVPSMGEKLDVLVEINRIISKSLKIEEVDETTMVETTLQCGLTKIAIVWFRGPDPGGTILGPFSLPFPLHP